MKLPLNMSITQTKHLVTLWPFAIDLDLCCTVVTLSKPLARYCSASFLPLHIPL